MQNDFDAIRADIARIPGTPEGDQIIARMINGQDPIKRLLASLEANRRARTRQQAKTPQMQQGRPPVAQEKAQQLLASGIGSLPVSEDMYSPRTMAGGGIVAFDGTAGSYVSLEDALKQYQDARGGIFSGGDRRKVLDPETGEETTVMALKEKQYLNALKRGPGIATFAPVSGDKSLAPTIANANANNLPPVKPDAAKPDAAKPPVAKPPVSSGKPDVKPPEAPVDPLAAYEAYLKGDAGADKEARREALNMLGVEAGLNILAGDSPYALQNIGQAQKAARGYGERLAELRKDQRARAKELAEFGLTKAKMAQDKELAELHRKTQKEVASIAASARGDSGEKLNANIIKGATAAVDKKLGLDREYFKLKTAAEKAAYRKKLIQEELGLYGVELPGAAGNTWAGWSQVK